MTRSRIKYHMPPTKPLSIKQRGTRVGRSCLPACGLAIALQTAACDPGWHYQALRGRAVQDNGLRYDVPSTNPKVRVYASAFAGSLNVDLTLMNIEPQPLSLLLPKLHVSDAKGNALALKFPPQATCSLVDDAMVIPTGESCTIAGVFAIRPLAYGSLIPPDNPDLARILVMLTTSEPSRFPDISVSMDWIR